MDRAMFERFCAFVDAFALAFDGSRAHHVIGTERFWELRLELTELAKRADQALIEERGRERVLTAPHAKLLHECLCVAHQCESAPANVRALMPVRFGAVTEDASYVMQQVDAYLLHKRIDLLGDRWR